jgi:hypothetical protein
MLSPSLPHPSSPRSSTLNMDDDDYDELYPAQYATRKDDAQPVFLNGIPPEFQRFQPENRLLTPLSAKFPAPDPKRQLPRFTHRRAASLNYTWSFVFGGRRRRISLPIITWEHVWAWCRYSVFFVVDLVRGRRVGGANLARDMFMDCLSVFLAAGLTWSVDSVGGFCGDSPFSWNPHWRLIVVASRGLFTLTVKNGVLRTKVRENDLRYAIPDSLISNVPRSR